MNCWKIFPMFVFLISLLTFTIFLLYIALKFLFNMDRNILNYLKYENYYKQENNSLVNDYCMLDVLLS